MTAEEKKEYRERIVACLMACEGISTDQLKIVAQYADDEARLSWLCWAARRASTEATILKQS